MSVSRSAILSAAAFVAFGAAGQPSGVPFPPPTVEARDVPYPGVIALDVDASDVARGIFRVRERIPVAQAGSLTLLYPEWLPGKHAPRGAINLLSGLEIRAGGELLLWRRDPVNVYAFHVDVPAGTSELDLAFQFVSPTQTNQGRVVVTREMLNLQWEVALLYPAGHYASRIRIAPSVKLPEGFRFATALDGAATSGRHDALRGDGFGDARRLAAVRGSSTIGSSISTAAPLGPCGSTCSRTAPISSRRRAEQIEPHRNLVQQAYRLFGSQHFDHYDFLLALTDRMGGIGLEHHRSTELGVDSIYFTDWERATSERDLLAHELVHSWNGKFRRPADLWTPSFDDADARQLAVGLRRVDAVLRGRARRALGALVARSRRGRRSR